MLFTVNQNKKASPEIVFHKILLKHMIFAYHHWNVIGIKDLKKTQKKASKTENSFCNQIVCFDSQCVAEATTKNFCNKQIKAKKRENQLPCVLALAYRVQLFLHRIIFPGLTLTIKNKAKLFYNQLHLLKEAENWDLNKYIPIVLKISIEENPSFPISLISFEICSKKF